MKKIYCLMFILMITVMFSCGKDAEMYGDKINKNRNYRDEKITCFQTVIKNIDMFQQDYVYDEEYPPAIYLYLASAKWGNLDDNQRDELLESIGKKWYDCNPANTAPLTLMVYDSNDIPLHAIFVEKEGVEF